MKAFDGFLTKQRQVTYVGMLESFVGHMSSHVKCVWCFLSWWY